MGGSPEDSRQQSRGASPVTFEQALKELREAQRLTQTDLAHRMGHSPSLVSLLESKKRLPTRQLIGEIARALNLTENEHARLLSAAGFPTDELSSAIQHIVALLARQTTLDETEQDLVRADLSAMVTSWRDLFDGLTQLRSGRLVDAREHFTQMDHHTEYSPTLKAALFIRRADVLVEVGELTSARMILSDVERVMEQWPEGWGLALRAERAGSVAMLELRAGQYASARRSLDESVRLYRELLHSATPEQGDRTRISAYWGLGKSHKRLAQIALFQGDIAEGLRCCRVARDYLERAPASSIRDIWLRRTKELEAWAHSNQGNFEEARRLHRAALDESRAARDAYGEARGYLYLGDDIRRALTLHVAKTLSPLPVTPEERRRVVAEALKQTPEGIGDIKALLEEAENYYKSALEHSNALGQRILLGRALLGRGVILRLKATLRDAPVYYDDAQHELEQALEVERQIGQDRRLPNVHMALAELAWEEGAPGWLERATASYQDARDALNAPGIRSADTASANQREAVGQALKALKQAAASLAAEPPAHIAPLRKWGAVIDPEASSAWREACAEAIEIIHQAIRGFDLEPYTLSAWALDWRKQLAEIEAGAGPRLLAQNRLSTALERRSYPEQEVEAAERTRYESLERSAHAGQNMNWDLCCRPMVEEGLRASNPSVMAQVCEAARLIGAYPHGYRLVAGKYKLPLSFEVKGEHALVEAPATLAYRFPHGEGVTLSQEAQVCYYIVDKDTARRLTEIFHRLVAAAEESIQLEETTAEWLGRHARAADRSAQRAVPAL